MKPIKLVMENPYLNKIENENKNRVERVLEEVLGIKKTKLEKLANSFSNVNYQINPNEKNSNTGTIYFFPKGMYFFKPTKSEIEKTAEKFYNKEDYIMFSSISDNGFTIGIIENFVNDIIKESVKLVN